MAATDYCILYMTAFQTDAISQITKTSLFIIFLNMLNFYSLQSVWHGTVWKTSKCQIEMVKLDLNWCIFSLSLWSSRSSFFIRSSSSSHYIFCLFLSHNKWLHVLTIFLFLWSFDLKFELLLFQIPFLLEMFSWFPPQTHKYKLLILLHFHFCGILLKYTFENVA